MLRNLLLLTTLAAAVVAAGCVGPDTERRSTGRGDTTGGGAGGNATVDANVTAGNGTAQGNTTIGTVGNATAGNETGNATGNATANATAGREEVVNGTFEYGLLPPDHVAFSLHATFRQLEVTAVPEGALAGLRVVLVDPGGNETVVLDGAVTAGSARGATTIVLHPAPGEWTLRFEGTGAGRVTVRAVAS